VTLVRAEVVPFGGELEGAVSNARSAWRSRHGVMLRLHDDRGNVGQGEASPLPDYSADDLGAARAALDAFARGAPGFDLEQPLDAIGTAIGKSAAARFALETAVLDLVGQRRGQPLWALLGENRESGPAQLSLSALVDTTSLEAGLRSAESARERGITTFKLKIGRRGAWATELRIAERLRATLGPALRLRFDANRAFVPSEAPARLRELAALDPEFVEEPLGASLLPALGRSPTPLALDESLLDPGLLERGAALRDAGVVAVVLKPMLLGGFSRCRALASRARALGLRVVVSHLFDGPIGLTAAAALALALAEDGDGAAGLDRHSALRSWQGLDLPAVTSAAVERWDAPGLGLPLLPGGAA
jgi:o-succinylbenzoate synthase